MQLTTIEGGVTVAEPEVPEAFLEETRKAWRSYWDSDLVQAVIDIDVVTVQAYFRLYDRWQRIAAIAEETPFTEGSTGQIVSHPAVAQAHQLLDDLTKLGATLGITPMARQRLGIVAAKAALSAEDVNKMARDAGGIKPARRRSRVINGEWEAVD